MTAMPMRRVLAVVVSAGVLASASCASGAPGGGPTPAPVTIAVDGPFSSANGSSATGDTPTDHLVASLTQSGLSTVDVTGTVVPDPSFGTVEKVSDDPLTVRYTLADTATWSDGIPVTPADLLLEWAALSGQLDTVRTAPAEPSAQAPAGAGTGSPTQPAAGGPATAGASATATPTAAAGVAFARSALTLADAPALPVIDGPTLTVRYARPIADWARALDVNLPAHVVGERALGMTDPAAARDAVVAAITGADTTALATIARVWNDDFDYRTLPDDEGLRLSTGPYLLTALGDTAATLSPNPRYRGDRPASAGGVRVRWDLAGLDQVDALKAGDVDLAAPTPAADVVSALGAVTAVRTDVTTSTLSDRLELQVAGGGVFDPAAHGGDAERALAVRQAFLAVVPRVAMAGQATDGVGPARTLDAFLLAPGEPGYADVTAANGVADTYGTVDADRARSLLSAVGATSPVQVRVLLAPASDRHTAQLALLRTSAERAGFTVQTVDSADPADYDAALVTAGTGRTPTAQAVDRYRTGGTANRTGLTDAELDGLLDTIARSTSRQAAVPALRAAEARLVGLAVGVPIVQLPVVAAWRTDRLTDVQPWPLLAGIPHARSGWQVATTTATP